MDAKDCAMLLELQALEAINGEDKRDKEDEPGPEKSVATGVDARPTGRVVSGRGGNSGAGKQVPQKRKKLYGREGGVMLNDLQQYWGESPVVVLQRVAAVVSQNPKYFQHFRTVTATVEAAAHWIMNKELWDGDIWAKQNVATYQHASRQYADMKKRKKKVSQG